MRKVVLDAAVTLDSYITGPAGDMGWLRCDSAGDFVRDLKSCEPNGCILATYEPA